MRLQIFPLRVTPSGRGVNKCDRKRVWLSDPREYFFPAIFHLLLTNGLEICTARKTGALFTFFYYLSESLARNLRRDIQLHFTQSLTYNKN